MSAEQNVCPETRGQGCVSARQMKQPVWCLTSECYEKRQGPFHIQGKRFARPLTGVTWQRPLAFIFQGRHESGDLEAFHKNTPASMIRFLVTLASICSWLERNGQQHFPHLVKSSLIYSEGRCGLWKKVVLTQTTLRESWSQKGQQLELLARQDGGVWRILLKELHWRIW